MKDHWYKNAIVYSLDVETFMDSDGDGVGDFQGLSNRLEHLAGLGITCLWLLPFYPSPNRDNGYDIMDYYNVDPRFGTLGDFVEFMHEAGERGIRVIVDLVVNHTSNQHPWFQAARADKNSKYRNYYVWADKPPENQIEPAFPDVEDSVWEYDEKAQAYYLHHFYKEQPDLNIANPAVQEEIYKIMGFWLELGVSGFRIDAAPFLIHGIGIEGADDRCLQNFLTQMRDFLSSRNANAVLIAEANVTPDKFSVYYGQGNRMHMLFNFILNQHMFLALARQQAAPLVDALKSVIPKIPSIGQWLNFVRHHDELDLSQLPQQEREEIFAAFAPEENMQIFGRGIRRRLPPMLEGNCHRIELVYSLMFSLPGTPLLRYGEEIAMGEDLSLEGRESVRTVMQWSDEPNGGFSTAPENTLARPSISQGKYGYKHVNVATEQRDPGSLMNWMERVIRLRKQCPEFGRGEWQILETDEPCVFAHCSQWQGRAMIAVHNLADRACVATIKTYKYKHLIELFCNQHYEPINGELLSIPLSAYGYRWFRVNTMR
ncbi:alpha-amylase family protein [Scytonema sp. NUACC21]